MDTKRKSSKKAKRELLCTLKLGYLNYIQNTSYQHYMDKTIDDDSYLEDFESQMVFTSHYFNNYVDHKTVENQELHIYQDDMHEKLNELSLTIFEVSRRLSMNPKEILNHFLDSQIHLQKEERYKINNIKPLLIRRIDAAILVEREAGRRAKTKLKESEG
jgi:hypothetical protein